MTTPIPISIVSPAIGAPDVGITPILSWTPYEGAKWYEVTMSEDPSFVIPEWSYNVNGLVYGVTETLKYNTNYYWRVRGVTADPYVHGTRVITPAGPWTVGAFSTKQEHLPSTEPAGDAHPVQVFVSHTQKDIEFCDIFDRACARVGIKAFRSEFEKINLPAWKTIRAEIRNSCALFLVVGKELVKAQSLPDSSWEHTQNWIAYEVGIACERGIDVWVICDNTIMNFPVPYLNNYLSVSLRNKQSFNYFVYSLQRYAGGLKTNFPNPRHVKECTHKDCKAVFNFPVRMKAGDKVVCPQCLQVIQFPKGWPV